jgi:4-hydroxy-tetrahydrodipicolinate synthase
MTVSLPRPLRGIVPPMITPLSGPDALDVAGLERLIEHMFAGGVHGLFILGTTGEAPSLSYRLRRELIVRTCKLVSGRVPVLVGITDTAFVESVSLAKHAADAGADAVVASAPYYFPADQPELMHYVRALAAQLPLPLMLYNMPAMTKIAFAVDTIRQAMSIDNIIGLKDSSGDMGYFHEVLGLLGQREEWTLLVGPENLLAESVMAGGHGGVNGGANLKPRLYVDLYEAAAAGDIERVRTLQRQVMRVGELYRIGQHGSSIIKGLKCALSTLGLCDDHMAEPFERFNPPERDHVAELLNELDVKR